MKIISYSESEIIFAEIPKSRRFINLSGRSFGELTVLGFAGQGKHFHSKWFCRCKCGNVTKVHGNSLLTGSTVSCGCVAISKLALRSTTHGQTRKRHHSPEYRAWASMMRRTQDPNHKNYSTYGARGITVCDSWKKFENFFTDMGERPKNTSIDRIDNNKGYSKENCRWATSKEQALNRRNNHLITYNNQTLAISQWADIIGIKISTLNGRITQLGWPIEKALTFPVRECKKR